jgi:hypothetical protein
MDQKHVVEQKSRWLLLVCAIGLVPIALSYGFAPARSMPLLLGMEVTSVELTHIFRAVMGLYFGMVCLWVLGAVNARYTRPALIACAVFMLGLAAGRTLSLMFDGMPNPLLVVYLALEVVLGLLALVVLNTGDKVSGA